MKILLLILVLISNLAYSLEFKKPVIVPSELQREKAQSLFEKEWVEENCGHVSKKSKIKYWRCSIQEAGAAARAEFPFRGSQEYCEKHYGPMTKEQGKAQLKEIESLWRKARIVNIDDKEPGEVSKAALRAEIHCLEYGLGEGAVYEHEQRDIRMRKLLGDD